MRIIRNKADKFVHEMTGLASDGALLFDYGHHPIFPATHPTMFRYLPMQKRAAVTVRTGCACAVYLQRSKQVSLDNDLFFVEREIILSKLSPRVKWPTHNPHIQPMAYCSLSK